MAEENNLIIVVEKSVRKIAEKEEYKNPEISIKPFSTNGANFMGELFYVDVKEEGKDTLHLFAKAANTTKETRTLISTNKIYCHEVLVYTTLAKIFEGLEEKHNVPDEKRFKFPKYYGSNITEMEEVLILENLSTQGYTLLDRLKPITWDYAKKALEEIAKFHTFSFVLKEQDFDRYEELIKSLPNSMIDESMQVVMDAGKKVLPVTLECVESKNKAKVKKFIDENIDTFIVGHLKPDTKHSILIHTDYRASNILVKYQGQNIIDLKPVDYQSVMYASPMNDIVYLLFTGSDEMFRRQYFEKYLEYYYNCLSDQLKLFSLDIKKVFPKYEFYFELKNKMPIGLEVALITLSAVLVDPTNVITFDEFVDPNEFDNNKGFKPSEAYVDRLNGIVRDFVKWGILEDDDNPTSNIETHSDKGTTEEVANNAIGNMEKFVKGIAIKEGFENFKIITKPISTEGANYTADLFHVDIREERKEPLHLFVKAANVPETVRKVMPVKEIYEHEVFIYTVLSDAYNELQEQHAVPIEKRFIFPKYYGSSLKEMEEIIVFENLVAQGYILYDRFSVIDWEYAKVAVEEIAKFHALSFALRKEYPYKFHEICTKLPNFEEMMDLMKGFAESVKNGLPPTVAIVEPESNRQRLQHYIDTHSDTFLIEHFKTISKYSTITHFDYRASNIMAKYEGNKVVALKPVDYQSASLGCPINDILYLLFSGSDETFRQQYFEQYLEHYHNSLAEFLKLLSQDVNCVWPKSAFYFELKDKMLYGLEVALVTLSIVLTEETDTTGALESLMNPDAIKKNSPKPNVKFIERVNGAVRDFVRWGFLEEGDENRTNNAVADANGKTEQNISAIVKRQSEIVPPKKTSDKSKKDNSCCAVL